MTIESSEASDNTNSGNSTITVLDPFCGTGSILFAAASLGAIVVGSDLDAEGLGLETGTSLLSNKEKYNTRNNVQCGGSDRKQGKSRKNQNFRGGLQRDKTIWDNFVFFRLIRTIYFVVNTPTCLVVQ